MQQRGHVPLGRRVAINILGRKWSDAATRAANHHLLLRIICRVREDPQIEPAGDSIPAFHDNAMAVSMYKLGIKNDTPLFVHELTPAMSHPRSSGSPYPTQILRRKVLERIR